MTERTYPRYQVHAMSKTGSEMIRAEYDTFLLAKLAVNHLESDETSRWIVDSQKGTPPEGLERVVEDDVYDPSRVEGSHFVAERPSDLIDDGIGLRARGGLVYFG